MNDYEAKRYTFIESFFKGVEGKLLDIGCHKGGLKHYLQGNIEYYGIDGLDEKFKNYMQVDLNDKVLPYPDKFFDAINCSAVLEHLFYPYEILCEAKRVLKNNGSILVALPNDKGLSVLFSYFFLSIESYDDSIAQHHWRFSIETAREFFEKEFRIVKEAPEFGPLFRKYLPFLKFKGFCTEWFMLGVKK
ncbi:MAG: class I SAM-dependent methyltransferase [Sedimentisphaerales bacterium]